MAGTSETDKNVILTLKECFHMQGEEDGVIEAMFLIFNDHAIFLLNHSEV